MISGRLRTARRRIDSGSIRQEILGEPGFQLYSPTHGSGPGTIPGWISGFDGSLPWGNTFSATISSNGMSYTAIATYSNS
jgi:hypothetical protein